MIFVRLRFKIQTMKKVFILFIVIIPWVSGCEKAKNTKPGIHEGTYTGTFQRIIPTGDAMISNVMVSFFKGKWNGQSDIPEYPALCNGSFSSKTDKLIFENDCAWTADFDWSLILSGEYNFEMNGDSLIILKDYNTASEYRDIYRLSLTKSGIKESPLLGTWVETLHNTDTIVFSPVYDGTFPIFNLNRSFRISEGYTLPDFYSGPYWYTLGANSISIKWFLSSNSLYNRYYFRVLPEGNRFEIENFFADPTIPSEMDTLTFVKIK